MKDFSLWCDFVEREFLANEFREMIARGEILGATSNPAIFANAILNSKAYKSDIENLRASKMSAKQIYENLAFSDIKRAADSLLPLYKNNANNGFISIEIDPNLCDDSIKSIDEGVRIFEAINMPNVMIKVPATEAGFEVMNALIARGISVNATLIFSQKQTVRCLEALNGVKNGTKAVISIFVSRFDRYLEANHNDLGESSGDSERESSADLPKLGIYNAMKCYELIQSFDNPNIRALFASTGTKSDDLPKSYYVENLLLPRAINTAPLDTIRDFVTRKCDFVKIPADLDNYLARFEVEKIARILLNSGLEAFKNEFEKMMGSI